MKFKKISLIASLGLMTLALASCGDSVERNTETPYGSLNLDASVAEAGNGAYKLSTKNYYDKLRIKGSSLVTEWIEKQLYSNYIDAYTALFNNYISGTAMTQDQKNLFLLSRDGKNLFDLDTKNQLSYLDDRFETPEAVSNFDVLQRNFIDKVNQKIATNVYGTYQTAAFDKMEENAKTISKTKFITEQGRNGNKYNASMFEYTKGAKDEFTVEFSKANLKLIFENGSLIQELINESAKELYGLNGLYQVYDKEYIKKFDAEEDDDETKNSFYVFSDDKTSALESQYNNTFAKYATYHAIIVQFNSKKDATQAVSSVEASLGKSFADLTTIAEKKDAYVKLYNEAYKYKQVTDADDDAFVYNVSSSKNDLDDVNGSVKKLITETLEDEDCLTEPRNLDTKYVMVLKFDTTYKHSIEKDGKPEGAEYDDLYKDGKVKEGISADLANIATNIDPVLKYNALFNYATSYAAQMINENLYNRNESETLDDDIRIYDPYLELQFVNTYEDYYTLTDKKYFKNDTICEIDGNSYKVEDFYKEASKKYGSQVISDYFQLEFTYVNFFEDYKDEDVREDNEEALDDAISEFNSNKNAEYPKEVGLETFLLGTYGYTSKEDVIKYFYDAKMCLTTYIGETVFEEWAKKNDDGTYSLANGLSTATTGILANILNTGNEEYDKIFELTADHILINIDDDNDGSPDDPEQFMKDMDAATKADFEKYVVAFSQAIYTEVSYIMDTYDTSSDIKTVFEAVQKKYEHGGENSILSDDVKDIDGNPVKNWDYFKKYNFLVKCESLGSIDQNSNKNYVKPFQDYVKNMYASCVKENISKTQKYGAFFTYDSDTEKGKIADSSADFSINSLCKTVFGYHMLILKSWEESNDAKYSGDLGNIEVLVKEDKDDEANNVYVDLTATNTNKTVSFNQFFIYYCQKQNSQTSSLPLNIKELVTSLYEGVINTYAGSTFQSYLLLKELDIKSTDEAINSMVKAELDYYGGATYGYDIESCYYKWITTDLDWSRPNKK